MKKLFLLKNLTIIALLYAIKLKNRDNEEGLQSKTIQVIQDNSTDNESEFVKNFKSINGYKTKLPNKYEKMVNKMKPISLQKRLNIDIVDKNQNDPFAITRVLSDAFKEQKDKISKILLHMKVEEGHNMVVNKVQQSAPELVEGFDKLGRKVISKLKLDDEFSELIYRIKFDDFKPNIPNKPYVFKDTVSLDKFENVKHVSGLKRVLPKDIPIYPDIHEVGSRVEIKPPFHKLFDKITPEKILKVPKKNPLEDLEAFFKKRDALLKKAKKKKGLLKKIILLIKKFFRLFYISPIRVKNFVKSRFPKKVANFFVPTLNKLKAYNKFIRTIVLLFMFVLFTLGFVGLIYLIIKLIIYLIKKIKKFYDENCKNFLVRSNNYNYIVNKLNLQKKK